MRRIQYICEEDAFAEQYSRLVARIVRPFFLKGGEYDDLYQEGMIGLLKAIRQYDPNRSDNFEAFATLCIKSRLYDTIRSDVALSRKEQQVVQQLQGSAATQWETAADPETLCLANETAKEIKQTLYGLLSPFEASVLDPYLEGFSASEIARQMHRPAKSVDNAVRRIRRKLAHYLSKGR